MATPDEPRAEPRRIDLSLMPAFLDLVLDEAERLDAEDEAAQAAS